jgi:ribosomal protein S20
MTKICTKCNTEKPLDNFAKDKNGKYGVKSKCKECIKEYRSVYNADNQDKIKEYFLNNKDKILDQHRKYYYDNHECI